VPPAVAAAPAYPFPTTAVAGPRIRTRARTAGVVTVLVALSALAHAPPLRDATTLGAAHGVRLHLSTAYVVLAPLCDLLDTTEGLALHAHYALIGVAMLVALAWRGDAGPGALRRGLRRAGHAVLAIAALYAGCVFVPRPTARLAATDPAIVIVDFHSHTRASHDGRRDFTVERNRAWHRATGFDVAYVTDHESVAGASEAWRGNPRRAGDGTVLLPGIELHDGRNHVNVLGVRDADRPAFAYGILNGGVLRTIAASTGTPRPVVLFTLPGILARANATGVVDAIEIADGAPRGLDQGDREHDALLVAADRSNLATVAGSNDHGLARAAVAWSTMRIPGWQAMSPAALDAAIQATIRAEGRHAVTVVERRTPMPGATPIARLVESVPAAAWGMLAGLTWPERLSWIVWAWAACALHAIATRARRPSVTPTDEAARTPFRGSRRAASARRTA
jgi:hypothetical protein